LALVSHAPADCRTLPQFKGLRTWKVAFTELRAARTKSLEPAAVRALIAARPGPLALFSPAAVLLDVREPAVFDGGHAVGAVNVPLYTSMEAPKDNFDKLRSAYFALFGLRVPVRNEDFAAQVLKRVGRKDVPLILQCQTGGTLETATERKIRAPRMPAPVYKEFGAASRSLMVRDARCRPRQQR
jgi:rhodanese-related sulfurtransferase